MKRVSNSDIRLQLDSKLINVQNCVIRFYTVNSTNYYIKKTSDDIVAEERDATPQDEEIINSGGTKVTEYFVSLDWSELLTIGEGVLQYKCTNNIIDNSFKDNWYNYNVERTTEYFINSNVFVPSNEEKGSISQLITNLHDGLAHETNARIVGDADLSDRLDAAIISGSDCDLSDYYTKGEVDAIVSGISGSDCDLSDYYTKGEVDTLISGVTVDVDLSDYYVKSEVNTLLADKLDVSAYTPYDDTAINAKVDAVSGTLETKLDASAYTPYDDAAINNKITSISGEITSISGEVDSVKDSLADKLDTSAFTPYNDDEIRQLISGNASDIATLSTAISNETTNRENADTAINGKIDVISGIVDTKLDASAYTPYDDTAINAKVDAISGAVDTKLDASAYTECDLSDYYNKTEVDAIVSGISGNTDDVDLTNYYDKTEVDTLLSDKLDVSAYTPYDDTAINAKVDAVSGVVDTKLDASAYTPYDDTAINGKIDAVSGVVDTKLDASAYTVVDLSDYYTTAQTNTAINNAVSGKAEISDLATISGNIQTLSANGIFNLYFDEDEEWSGETIEFYTKEQVNALLTDKLDSSAFTASDYATTASTYTKTDIDGMIGNLETLLSSI